MTYSSKGIHCIATQKQMYSSTTSYN